MPTIEFTANLQRHIKCETVEAVGDTIGEALLYVFAQSPALRSYIVDEQGGLRPHVVVFINGTPVRDRQRLSDHVDQTDKIYVFQALSGG